MVPRIFGPYEAIRRDYSIEEFLGDCADLGVTRSVYVQTNWAPDRYEDEVAWVQGVANRTDWPHACVAYADMMSDDVRPQLDRLAGYQIVRGIRMQLHWHQIAAYRFAPTPDQLNAVNFRRNVDRLREYGFSFDLQLFPAQLADGARVAAEHPDVRFVLIHAGMLVDTAPNSLAEWTAGMALLADQPNVFVKLSGLGTFVRANDREHIAPIVSHCVETFGAERCMFGSNFPIEKIWSDYGSLLRSYEHAIETLSPKERNAVLAETAMSFYRLETGEKGDR